MNTYVLLQELSWPGAPKQIRLAAPRGKSNPFGIISLGIKVVNAEQCKILSHNKKSLIFIASTSKTEQGLRSNKLYFPQVVLQK